MNPKSVLEGEPPGEPLSFVAAGEVNDSPRGSGGRAGWRRSWALAPGFSARRSCVERRSSCRSGKSAAPRAGPSPLMPTPSKPWCCAPARDGGAAEPPNFLAQLTSGDTLPLRLAADESLSSSPRGGRSMSRQRNHRPLAATPADPRGPIDTSRRNRLTVLPTPREMKGASSRLGPLTLQATDLAALWPTAVEPPEAASSGGGCLARRSVTAKPPPRAPCSAGHR